MGRGRLACWRNVRWGLDQLAVRAFSRVVGFGLVGCPLVGSIVYLLCLSGNVFTASHCEAYDSIHSSLYTETPVHVNDEEISDAPCSCFDPCPSASAATEKTPP